MEKALKTFLLALKIAKFFPKHGLEKALKTFLPPLNGSTNFLKQDLQIALKIFWLALKISSNVTVKIVEHTFRLWLAISYASAKNS